LTASTVERVERPAQLPATAAALLSAKAASAALLAVSLLALLFSAEISPPLGILSK
jgi:hypothetical protein